MLRAMLSRYDDDAAPEDALERRCYTSRLLGAEPSLVLHGGGNTSVKLRRADFFGDPVEALYVKGSGWDLASIEPAGFSPVRLDVLLRMAELPTLSDADMVREQRAALLDPSAPNPSVEAILHAVIEAPVVDHTHADAVVALSNTPDGEARLRELYPERVLFVPYVMPGFVLARAVYEQTRGVDFADYDAMILLNHGVFTWGEDAKESYERMIAIVDRAEKALEAHGALEARGPVTPDHVIRTKHLPVVLGDDPQADVRAYADAYSEFFARHDDGTLTQLDPAPRWAVWPGRGLVSFGATARAADQVRDIVRHTARCIQWAEAMGGWTPLPESDLFAMEYWELEQKKLARSGAPPELAGKVALVTGAAEGIGGAIAEALRKRGASVCVVDIAESVGARFAGADSLALVEDLRERGAIERCVARCVREFGGLDLLVLNAGVFPPSQHLADIDDATWEGTLDVNVSSHMRALRAATPHLRQGVESSVLVVASKNVPAPGPGAAAYSASKAALTQLARVAALELAPSGVRVNIIHPDKVFDTGLWTEEKVAARAASYGLSVEAYKRSNLLGIEVGTADVAAIACALLGPAFRACTGAQVPIDGGNNRVV